MTTTCRRQLVLAVGVTFLVLISAQEAPKNETAPTEAEPAEEKPKYVPTGNPQIDYKFDPNLPRELKGFDLSDYPFYKRVPDVEFNFTCDGRHDGFYASIPHKCQVYHHCLFEQRFDFLCANYTAFDQTNFICHFANEVDCENSELHFHRNDALYKEASTTTTTTAAPKIQIVYVDRPRPKKRPRPGKRPTSEKPPATDYDYYYYEDQPVAKPDTQQEDLYDDTYYYDETTPKPTTTTTTTTRRTVQKRPVNRPGRRPGRPRQGVGRPGAPNNQPLRKRKQGQPSQRVRRPNNRRKPGMRRRRKKTTTTPATTTTTTTTTTAAPEYYDYYEYYYDDTTTKAPTTPRSTVSPLARLSAKERRKNLSSRRRSQLQLAKQRIETATANIQPAEVTPADVEEPAVDEGFDEYYYDDAPPENVKPKRTQVQQPSLVNRSRNRRLGNRPISNARA